MVSMLEIKLSSATESDKIKSEVTYILRNFITKLWALRNVSKGIGIC